jgi:hypothetical protein
MLQNAGAPVMLNYEKVPLKRKIEPYVSQFCTCRGMKLLGLNRAVGRLKSDPVVAAIAKRPVGGSRAPTERKSWLPRCVVLIAVGVYHIHQAVGIVDS